MKELFKEFNFRPDTLAVIAQANAIIGEYQAQGYTLTLRQLYYQFVSRDFVPNTQRSYKRLGGIINDGRLAGLIDWDAIEDRTRNLVVGSHWDEPSNIIQSAADSFRIDKWEGQEVRFEVWIEKEALAGVITKTCRKYDVPYIACRGYMSQSEMYASAMRYKSLIGDGIKPIILHLGDHDPSGIDMTRDIDSRVYGGFGVEGVEVKRLALNFSQVEEYAPPPNPAKDTDSRFEDYRAKYGDESWELDALEPKVINELISETIEAYIDADLMDERIALEERGRDLLEKCAGSWDRVVKMLDK